MTDNDEIFEPTMQLRFVRRPNHDNPWATALQQLWVPKAEYGFCLEYWRDVLVEEEQKP